MTINKESLRSAFERWWVDSYGESVGPVTSDGGYAHQSTDADWLVWCAAFESLGADWKIVPVTPTLGMVAAADRTGKRVKFWVGDANVAPAMYAAMIDAAPSYPEVRP